MKTRRVTAVFVVVLIVSLAASALVVRQLDRLRAGSVLEDVSYIPSAQLLKRLSLGYNTLLADVYWTRAVQYFGRKHHTGTMRYDLLYPLLDLTTDMDPHLVVAYQFGSIFLAQKPPEGAGEPRLAVELVEKGIRANPKDWQLYYNLGWIQASELKDYAAASAAFERASHVAGANPAFKVMAAAMAQHGGDTATARFMWLEIYRTTENQQIRANAIKRLQALKVDADVPMLERALADYKHATGRLPSNWAELEATGWHGPTIDPVGNAYRIMPDGRVEVADIGSLPFINRGLPPGQMPSMTPTSASQIKSVRSEIGSQAPPPDANPEPKH